jgi:hypothetical protein
LLLLSEESGLLGVEGLLVARRLGVLVPLLPVGIHEDGRTREMGGGRQKGRMPRLFGSPFFRDLMSNFLTLVVSA